MNYQLNTEQLNSGNLTHYFNNMDSFATHQALKNNAGRPTS